MEGIKAIYRDNQFFREKLRYMLSDEELKKIIELNKYNEEEEKCNAQSFTLEEKSLALTSVKLGQIGGGFGNNRLPEQKKNDGNKQIIFQNFGNEDNNNDDKGNNNEEENEDNYLGKQNLPKGLYLKNSKSNKRIKEINPYGDQTTTELISGNLKINL